MKRKNQSGQALVFTSIAMVAVLGFVGLGIDMGMLRYQKRLQQTAADAAALAGASNLTLTGVQAGGGAAAAANGFTDTANGVSGSSCADVSNTTVGTVTVTICNHPQDVTINGTLVPGGPHTADVTTASGAVAPAADYVEAIVSVVQPTYFMQIFGVPSETVIARAVATNFSGAINGTSAGCLYTLAPPSANGINGVNVQGSAQLIAPGCGILDNGNYDPTGNSPNLIIQAGTFAVSGTDTGSKKLPTCTVTPNNCPVYAAPPTKDPLFTLTAPTAPAAGSFNSATNTYSPGSFTGINITSNGTITFSPGLYYMTGNVSCSGTPTITGTGVTFYFTGTATWNCTGNVTVNLTAPTSGTYQDILFFEDKADTAQIWIGGNTGSTFSGIIYAPSAQVEFFGDSKGNNGGITTDIIVAASIDVQGNPIVHLAGLGGLPAPPPPVLTVGTATLVE
jgi:hypothetical protein